MKALSILVFLGIDHQNPVVIAHEVKIECIQVRARIQIDDHDIGVNPVYFADQRMLLMILRIRDIPEAGAAGYDTEILIIRIADNRIQIFRAFLEKEIVQPAIGLQAEHQLKVRTAQVRIDDHDLPAFTGNLDRDIRAQAGLADPAFTTTESDYLW